MAKKKISKKTKTGQSEKIKKIGKKNWLAYKLAKKNFGKSQKKKIGKKIGSHFCQLPHSRINIGELLKQKPKSSKNNRVLFKNSHKTD